MKIKYFTLYWLPVIIYAVIIFLLSSRPLPSAVVVFDINTKILHMVEFFLLAVLLFRAINNSQLKEYSYSLTILLTAIYGFLDEIHQGFVPGRFAELGDALADTFGGCLTLFNLLIPKNTKISKFLMFGIAKQFRNILK